MYIAKQLILLVSILLVNFSSVAQEKVIDLHMHLWDKEASLELYQNHVDTLDFEVARMGGILIAQQDIQETRANNDWILELSRKNTKLIPIGSVHPYDGEAALEELRRISQLGIKIVKLHPITQRITVDDDRVIAFCREAGVLGLIVLVDNANFLKADDVESLLTLALQCGQTQFIYAHMGALNFRSWSILKLLRTTPNFYKNNIYFDVSGTVTLLADSPLEEEFVWVLRSVGIEKILMGSDFPQWNVAETVAAVKRLGLNDREIQSILYENAIDLLSQ